jgi:hypothetical protein
MRFLLRVIGMFVVLFAALSIVRRILLAFTPAPQVTASASPAGHLVKDPVCGTFIPQATAIKAGEHFFCSEQCRNQFGVRK